MARTRTSTVKRARHKKWIKRAKGYRGRRNRVFKLAKEAVLKAGQHAYKDRRRKKRERRAQWQTQINAAARAHDISYSQLMGELRTHEAGLDRKVLAQLAVEHPQIFADVVEQVRKEEK